MLHMLTEFRLHLSHVSRPWLLRMVVSNLCLQITIIHGVNAEELHSAGCEDLIESALMVAVCSVAL